MDNETDDSILCESTPGDRGHWMTTFSGRKFYPLDPREEDMDIVDVGHHLAMQCRYNGACHAFFSVAEHCVIGSYLVPKEHAYDFLMHDVAETWSGDLIRPLKHGTLLGQHYDTIEDRIFRVARNKWNFNFHPSVKQIDREMILIEQRQLFPNFPASVDWEIHPKIRLECWAPMQAKEMFMKRFIELRGNR